MYKTPWVKIKTIFSIILLPGFSPNELRRYVAAWQVYVDRLNVKMSCDPEVLSFSTKQDVLVAS